MEYYFYQVGAQATYSGLKVGNVTLGAGYQINREYDFFRSEDFQKYKGDGAPYVKLSFEAKF